MTLHLSETDLKPLGLIDLQMPLIVTLVICLVLACLLYTSPSPRDMRSSRMPSSA